MSKKTPQRFDTSFNSYAATGVIGEGGTGIVYAVTDQDENEFALKLLRPEHVSVARTKRFKNEIAFCERNDHSHILTVADHGFSERDAKKCPFYVMPKYDGTLRTLLDNGIAPERVLRLFAQILDGVEAAHLQGVWHRDLKPENILFDAANDHLIVADFGIAHFNESQLVTSVETRPGSRMANFQYSAPEQRVKNGDVGPRADIYALGVLVNEMFTGDILQGTGYTTIESGHADYGYLDEIVDALVQQDPANRPASIDVVKQTLRARQHDFVGQQRIDKLANTVVPKYSVDDEAAATVVSVTNVSDYRADRLVFSLDRVPTREWIQTFHTINYGNAIVGRDPQNFVFTGAEASVPAYEGEVQRIVSDFKRWVDVANDDFIRQLEEAARQREHEEREGLKAQLIAEEKRQRILKMVNS